MRFYTIIKLIIDLISSPASTWEKLAAEIGNTSKKDTLFFYSLLSINFIACFLGNLFNGDDFPVVVSMLRAIIWTLAIFAAYWGVYYVLVEVMYKRFHVELNRVQSNRLIYYSFSLFLIINILTSLLPDILFFLKIAYIYTLFIVWEGVGKMVTKLEENEKSNFVLFLSASIILLPIIINQVLLLAVPTAR